MARIKQDDAARRLNLQIRNHPAYQEWVRRKGYNSRTSSAGGHTITSTSSLDSPLQQHLSDEEVRELTALYRQHGLLPDGYAVGHGGEVGPETHNLRDFGIVAGTAIGGPLAYGALAGGGAAAGSGAGAGSAAGGAMPAVGVAPFAGLPGGIPAAAGGASIAGAGAGAAGAGAAGAGAGGGSGAAGAGTAAAGGGMPGWLETILKAAPVGAGLINHFASGDGPAGGTAGQVPPELSELLALSMKRMRDQEPLFQAVTRQALAGLPNYAREN